MTLTESLISSFILVGLATQTGKLFGDSMQALGKSRLRDEINAAIHRDLEDVRQVVSAWKADGSMTTNGHLAYVPDTANCNNGTLATALLSDNTTTLPASSILDLSSSSTPLQGPHLSRTIGTSVGNTNLIQVVYSTNIGSSLKSKRAPPWRSPLKVGARPKAQLPPPSFSFNTAMKASWGTSTLPMAFIRFLPFACFFSSFFFREISPP